jgi:hypothetical protein
MTVSCAIPGEISATQCANPWLFDVTGLPKPHRCRKEVTPVVDGRQAGRGATLGPAAVGLNDLPTQSMFVYLLLGTAASNLPGPMHFSPLEGSRPAVMLKWREWGCGA